MRTKKTFTFIIAMWYLQVHYAICRFNIHTCKASIATKLYMLNYLYKLCDWITTWAEQWTSEPKIPSSNPGGDKMKKKNRIKNDFKWNGGIIRQRSKGASKKNKEKKSKSWNRFFLFFISEFANH